MSKVVTEFVRPLVDAFQVPLILALCVILIVAITRIVSGLWYFSRQRGQRPLVIRVEGGRDETPDATRRRTLDESLLAYLAADGDGNYVIAPGAGRPAAPRVMTEALDPASGWQAALLRLALARQRSYLVDVTWSPGSQTDPDWAGAVVRISRAPDERIVASSSFGRTSVDELIQTVGCFCIIFLRTQQRTLRHTPRWERWGQGVQGYRAYRTGLEHQRRAELTPPLDGEPGSQPPPNGQRDGQHDLAEYQKALAWFNEAARFQPANLLVQLHRAALLELTGNFAGAAAIYQKCRILWPEHIETAYRMTNALRNLDSGPNGVEDHLGQVEKQLARKALAIAWLRTFRPWRWSPGERAYWRSWMQLRLPGRVSRRATYLRAIAVAKLLVRMSFLNTSDNRSPAEGAAAATALMENLARQLLRKDAAGDWKALLDPGAGNRPADGDPAASGTPADPSHIPTYSGAVHRSDTGWLALFNAACFFSQAIDLHADYVPEGFSPDRWRDACARAAVRELGILVRNPQHALEPDWLGTDKDLRPLLESRTGRAWASFVGLPVLPSADVEPGRLEETAGR